MLYNTSGRDGNSGVTGSKGLKYGECGSRGGEG